MLSLKKMLIPTVVGASLLLAACGGSSQKSSSNSSPASASPSASQSTSGSNAGLTIGTASGPTGTYLTGASGRALYLWVADSEGKSNCSSECAKAWPPLTATSVPQVAGAVKASDLSLISRSDGTKQVAYKGHPLYYFVADTGPGMTKGQGSDSFGAKWWLVAPAGSAITNGGSSASTSTSGSPSSSSGGSSSGGSSSGGSPYSGGYG